MVIFDSYVCLSVGKSFLFLSLVVDLPPEKYATQHGSSSQLLGKIKNPNHQPVIVDEPTFFG
jgi:hypothetical protein